VVNAALRPVGHHGLACANHGACSLEKHAVIGNGFDLVAKVDGFVGARLVQVQLVIHWRGNDLARIGHRREQAHR